MDKDSVNIQFVFVPGVFTQRREEEKERGLIENSLREYFQNTCQLSNNRGFIERSLLMVCIKGFRGVLNDLLINHPLLLDFQAPSVLSPMPFGIDLIRRYKHSI